MIDQEKVTIKVAAIYLGVHEKSIHRYIAKGLLEKVKDGYRSYVLMSQVLQLGQGQVTNKKKAVTKNSSTMSSSKNETVAVDRSHYDGLLIRLGQFETEIRTLRDQNQKLLEDKRYRDNQSWWRKLLSKM